MVRSVRRGAALALPVALAGLLACTSKVPASNPFDPATPVDQQAKGQVSGQILLEAIPTAANPSVTRPAPGASITLDDGSSTSTLTDGTFTVSATPGTRLLSVTLTGFHDAAETHVFRMTPGGAVALSAPITLQLDRGAVIGTVAAGDGRPVDGAEVSLAGTSYQTAVVPSLAGAATGAFRFSDLPAGTYQVVARSKGYAAASAGTVTVSRGAVVAVAPITLAPASGDFAVVDADPTHEAGFTRFRSVTLQLHFAGAAGVRAAEEPTFGGGAAPFLPYPAGGNLPFTLSAQDGTHQLYVQTRDSTGNTSGVYSASVVLDQVPPSSPSVVAEGGVAFTNHSPTLALTLLATETPATGVDVVSGVWHMRLSRDGALDAGGNLANYVELPYQRDLPYLVPSSEPAQGLKSFWVQFRDGAGNLSDPAAVGARTSITIDTQPPNVQLLAIQPGPRASQAGFTNQGIVTLQLAAQTQLGDTVLVRLANSAAGLSTAALQPMTAQLSWALDTPSTDGLKTVYARFSNLAGNVAPDVNTTIQLKTAPPSGSVTIVAGGVTAPVATRFATGTLAFNVSPDAVLQSVASAPVDCSALPLSAFAAMPSGTPPAVPIALGPVEGPQQQFACLRDAAGNVSSAGASTVFAITPPSGTLTVGNGQPVQAGLAFTAQLAASAHVTQMALGLDSPLSCATASYGAFAASAPIVFTAQGQHSVFVCLQDWAGNLTAAPLSVQVFADSAPPVSGGISIQGVYADGSAFPTANTLTASQTVTLTLSPSDTGGSGVAQMRLTNASSFSAEAWQPYSSSVVWTLPAGDGAKTVRAQFMDRAGQVSSSDATGSITLHAAPPSASSLVIAGGVTPINNASPTIAVGASGAVQVAISIDGLPAAPSWQALPVTSLALGADGFHTVLARFRSDTHVEGPTATASVTLKTTPPVPSAISLQGVLGNGALSTSLTQTTAVQVSFLSLSSDTTAIQLVEPAPAGSCAAGLFSPTGTWLPVNSSLGFSLRAGDGPHTVCAAFRDAAGNLSTAAAPGAQFSSASITLDATPPANPGFLNVTSGYSNQNAAPASGLPQVTLVTDNLSPTPTYQCLGGQFSSWTDCQPGALVAPVQLPQAFVLEPSGATAPADGTYTLGVRARDNAYNVSQGSFVTVTRLTVAPTAPILTDAIPAQSSIRVRWKASTSGNVSSYLINYGTSTGSTSGTGAAQGASPIAVGDVNSFQITGLAQGTPYYLSVSAVDFAGNVSLPSNERLVVPNEVNPRLLASFGTTEIALAGISGNHIYVGAPESILQMDVTDDTQPVVVRRAVLPGVVPVQGAGIGGDQRSAAANATLPLLPCTVQTVSGTCVYVAGQTLQSPANPVPLSIAFFPGSGGGGYSVGSVPDRAAMAAVATPSTGPAVLATLTSVGINLYSLSAPTAPSLLAWLPFKAVTSNAIVGLASLGTVGNTVYALVYELALDGSKTAHLIAIADVTAAPASLALRDLGRFLDPSGKPNLDDNLMVMGGNTLPIPLFLPQGLYLFWSPALGTFTGPTTPFSVSRYAPLISMTPVSTLQISNTLSPSYFATSATAANGHLYITDGLGNVNQIGLDASSNPQSTSVLTNQVTNQIVAVAGITGGKTGTSEHYYAIAQSGMTRYTPAAGVLTPLPAAAQYSEIPDALTPMAMWNGLLFVGSFSPDLAISQTIWAVDLTNPEAAVAVAKWTSPRAASAGGYTRLRVVGNLLFAGANDGTGGVDILRIGATGALTLLTTVSSGTAINDLAVNGNTLFAATSSGILSFNVTNPAAPVAGTTYGAGNTFWGIEAARATLYGTSYSGSASTFSVFTLGTASATGTVALTGLGQALSVSLAGSHAYVSDSSGTLGVDVSNSAAPRVNASFVYPVAGPTAVHGGYLFGPSPQGSSDGVRAVSLGTGQVRGTLPYAQCTGGNLNNYRPGFVEWGGGFIAECGNNGIQWTSFINLFGGSELWQANVATQTTSAALTTDGSSLFFSGAGANSSSNPGFWFANEDGLPGSNALAPALNTMPTFTPAAQSTAQSAVLLSRPGLLFSAETNFTTGVLRTLDTLSGTQVATLTLGNPYIFDARDDGAYLYLLESQQIEIVDARNPAALSVVDTVPVGYGNALALGRNRLYALSATVGGAVGVWDTTQPATTHLNPLVTIPAAAFNLGQPAALVANGSLLWASTTSPAGAQTVALSPALDGTGAAYQNGVFLQGSGAGGALAVAGDALMARQGGVVAVADLGPFFRTGSSPVITGGQSLAETPSTSTTGTLRLDGPFALQQITGVPLRLFDLR